MLSTVSAKKPVQPSSLDDLTNDLIDSLDTIGFRNPQLDPSAILAIAPPEAMVPDTKGVEEKKKAALDTNDTKKTRMPARNALKASAEKKGPAVPQKRVWNGLAKPWLMGQEARDAATGSNDNTTSTTTTTTNTNTTNSNNNRVLASLAPSRISAGAQQQHALPADDTKLKAGVEASTMAIPGMALPGMIGPGGPQNSSKLQNSAKPRPDSVPQESATREEDEIESIVLGKPSERGSAGLGYLLKDAKHVPKLGNLVDDEGELSSSSDGEGEHEEGNNTAADDA